MDNVNSLGNNALDASYLNFMHNSFIRNTDLIILFTDLNGIITEVNDSFLKLTGYPSNEIIGRLFIDLLDGKKDEVAGIFDKPGTVVREKVECRLETEKFKSAVQCNIISLADQNNVVSGFAIQISPLKESSVVHSGDVFLSELENTISKFTTLIDNSRDVLYSLFVHNFKFEYLSSSVVELTGFTREELMAMQPREMLQIIHPDYRRMYLKYWNSFKLRQNRQHQTIEYKIRPKLGISRWLSDNHKVIWDEKGKIVKLVGNIRDITDFKLVEEALNRSRDRLYKAIEATNDGMWDWRVNTNKVYFDARFYTMLGYEPLEFPAAIEEWMSRIHPDEIKGVRNLLSQHLDGKSNQWSIEYRFLAKNGDWVWVLNKGKVFELDDNGKPSRMVGTHSDISLRKKAEEELQKRNDELNTLYDQLQVSEEKFRQLAENTQDVFWLRNEDHIIYINSAFDKVWGRNREEVILNPQVLKEWLHPEDQERFNSWIAFNTFENQKYYIEKYRIIKPNGESRWLWSRMFPVYNEKGQIYRIAGIASDITDQKIVEEALIAAREKAMESDQLKSAFLANISHEIRTPMNGIIGFAELLKDDNLSLENRIQYVNVITKSSEQLLHIIDDIIDISKIEANQVKINLTKVRISDLLSNLLLFYQNERVHIGKADIDIIAEVSSSHKDITINTDESRLRQILMNLISNSLKFTEKGCVKFGFNQKEDSVEFYVSDSGIGIPHDRQSQIFKRFRQLDDSFTRKFGGTGLGLAICEGLVKLLGGRIWVVSEINKGATFYFTISTGNEGSKTLVSRTDNTSSGEYNWSGKTILVVEDDEINQEFLIAVLSPSNVDVICASTGEEAVSIANKNNNIDLVLMDIRLPQMNGYEAFEKIRQKHSSLPVIAQTAFAMTEDATRCLEFGFSDYISKPINRKNLLSMINKLLTK